MANAMVSPVPQKMTSVAIISRFVNFSFKNKLARIKFHTRDKAASGASKVCGASPNAGQAVQHHQSCVRWGSDKDLYIGDNPHLANRCYSRDLGQQYNPPPGGQVGKPGTYDYFAEAESFRLAEWEVFRVGADPAWV